MKSNRTRKKQKKETEVTQGSQIQPFEQSRELRFIGLSYLAAQQTRISQELRIHKLFEDQLVNAGLAERVEKVDPVNQRRTINVRTIEGMEEQIKLLAEKMNQTRLFQIMHRTRRQYSEVEKNLMHDAEEIFNNMEIWKFCESVKGLGSVAALTFLTVINIERIADPVNKVVTAGKVWAYLGLQPGMKLVSGKKAGYNTYLKGRVWVVAQNVIMAGDSYYQQVYRIQKNFYQQRPDIAAQQKTKKGWKGWVDAMARRWMLKLLISHAAEVIAVSLGFNFTRHTNYLPPKPEDERDQDAILARFTLERKWLLERYIEESKANNGEFGKVAHNMQTYWQQTHRRYDRPISSASASATTDSEKEEI